MEPPLHPIHVQVKCSMAQQETSCYSEKSPTVPVLMALRDSEEATVEKAQQDPHCPWSLTF